MEVVVVVESLGRGGRGGGGVGGERAMVGEEMGGEKGRKTQGLGSQCEFK